MAAKLAKNSVTNAAITNGVVGTNKLGNGVVTTVKLADKSVTTAKLGDEVGAAGRHAEQRPDPARHRLRERDRPRPTPAAIASTSRLLPVPAGQPRRRANIVDPNSGDDDRLPRHHRRQRPDAAGRGAGSLCVYITGKTELRRRRPSRRPRRTDSGSRSRPSPAARRRLLRSPASGR